MDKITKREVILDNYQNPYNKGLVGLDGYLKENTRSESCIDNIDLEVKIENNKISDAHFDGEACAICTSATSMLVKNLIGKSIDEAEYLILNYQNMINEEEYDKDVLNELNALDDIYLQPARKNCALLSSKSAKKILDKVGD